MFLNASLIFTLYFFHNFNMAAVAGEAEQIGSAGARALAAAVLRLRVDMPDLPVAQIARAAAEQVDVE